MISRCEVALVGGKKGLALGLMAQLVTGPFILVVFVTTVITPILLKVVYHHKNKMGIMPVE